MIARESVACSGTKPEKALLLRLGLDRAAQRVQRIVAGGYGLLIGSLDLLVHFLAVHPDRSRRVDADPDGVTTNFEHGEHDVIANDDALAHPSGQNQHRHAPARTSSKGTLRCPP